MGESSGGGGSRDELLSIGAHGGAFGTLGSPMLAPVAAEPDSKKVWLWAAVGAIAIMSTAAVAIAYVMRAPAAPPPPVAMLPQSAPANTVAAGATACAGADCGGRGQTERR